MSLLPAETIGSSYARIEYNGFVFPSYLSQRLSFVPVVDNANRVVRNLKFNLTIDVVITWDSFTTSGATANQPAGSNNAGIIGMTLLSGDRLDPAALPFFRRISEKGKRLTIHGLGVGEIDVDPSSGSQQVDPDLDNGPTPKVGNITWVRNARAFMFTWECEFTISACRERRISKTEPTIDGLNFSTSYGVAENGVMNRVISGTVTLPNWVKTNTVGQKVTAINPDATGTTTAIKDRLLRIFPAPKNCQRVSNFTTSHDRTRVDFTLTDTEIPSDDPYYPGTVRMVATHTVANNSDATGAVGNTQVGWTITFTGHVEIHPGQPKSLAWSAIIWFLRSRLREQIGTDNSYSQTKLAVTDNVFERSVSFSFSYQALFSLESLFLKTRLGMPITSDQKAWENWDKGREKSLKPYSVNGEKEFQPNALIDYVVTLCDTNTNQTSAGSKEPDRTPQDNKSTFKDIFTNVNSEASYSYFNNKIWQESDYNVVTPAVIGQGDAAQQSTERDRIVSKDSLNLYVKGTGDVTPNAVQVRGAGQHYVIVEGSAKRVRYPIMIPSLRSIGSDLPIPVLVSEKIEPSQILAYTPDDVPIYSAKWRRVYCLPNLGNRQITMSNVPVQFGTPDGANSSNSSEQVSFNLFNFPKPRVNRTT